MIESSAPLPGLGSAFKLKVSVFEKPVNISGKNISGDKKPDWADALFVIRYPQGSTFSDFQANVTPEYIDVNGISLNAFNEAASLPKDKVQNFKSSYFYSLLVSSSDNEYLIVVGTTFSQPSQLPPSDQLVAATFKRDHGKWKAYPISANPGLSALPWNNLTQMQGIWKSRKVKMGEYGNLVSVDKM